MALSEYDIECIAKARALIEADLSVHYSIAHLASVSGIGATRLKKGFKETYGASLYAYLRERRMVKAAALLEDTRKTIKQVAKATGFHYTNNFSAAFIKYHKMSPAAYRRLKKEK